MLFNSYEFLFVFLPLVWLGWWLALRLGGLRAGVGWLSLSSLGFYGFWNWVHFAGSDPWNPWAWRFTLLLVISLTVNFWLGKFLASAHAALRKPGLLLGLAWNLFFLGYFKYWNFLLTNINELSGAHFALEKIILPIGISFFTFQKIAFLVDAYRGKVREVRFLDFSLFVLFFPQLIAGPIVHHGDFIPQIREDAFRRINTRNLALGLAVFSAGIFQKCVIADGIAPMAQTAFGIASQGTHLRLLEAWTGALAYTFQLFYDFSGYSHMAIGLALLFGFKLPVNFLAPYTSKSMIEFWRRWHMTLSSFLRDYVYIPLGGNRNRHLTNLFITMFVAGLWHGAGWTFILWGVWHGLALIANHCWRDRHPIAVEDAHAPWWTNVLTMVVVTFGWVLFQAADVSTAFSLMQSMVGWHGISVPVTWESWVAPLAPAIRPRGIFPYLNPSLSSLVLLALSAWFACRGPRLLAWFGLSDDEVAGGNAWQKADLAPAGQPLKVSRALIAGLMLAMAIATLGNSSPFLYFQF